MSMLADDYRFVVAVDTHRDTHTAAVLVTGTGAAVDIEQVPADPGGYDELITVADRYGVTPERVWVIEGAGSYGAGLARHLLDRGERIIEVDRPTRPKRRNGAKSDEIDAVRSGREALTRRYPGEPRSLNGDRAALAVLLTTRRSAKDAAKTAKQQLHALIISAPEILRDRFRGLSTTRMITLAAKLRINPAWDSETRIVAGALRQLARRARDLDNEAVTHRNHIELIVKAWRPDLLDQKGVGPVVAATILCAWSHPGPDRSVIRARHPSPPQPLRRPATQPGTPHHCVVPAPLRPRDPRLRRPPHRRRENTRRDPTLPQALRQPTDLPPPRKPHLTSIGASPQGGEGRKGARGCVAWLTLRPAAGGLRGP